MRQHLAMSGLGEDEVPVVTVQGHSWFGGVDPGLSGCAALLSADGKHLKVFPVPKTGDDYDVKGMWALVESWRGRVTLAVIEQQQSMPGNFGGADLKIGFGYGLWMMALAGNNIPLERVRPVHWKANMGITPPSVTRSKIPLEDQRTVTILRKKMKSGYSPTPAEIALDAAVRESAKVKSSRRKESKQLAVVKAKELFPNFSFKRTEKCSVDDDNIAEAALLAVVAQRRFHGSR